VEKDTIILDNSNTTLQLPFSINNSCSENYIYTFSSDNSIFNTSTEINGNILIGGSENGEALLVEMDSEGTEIWRKKFNNKIYGWDGRYKNNLMNPGVFVYYAIVLLEDGSTKMFSGSVTLIH